MDIKKLSLGSFIFLFLISNFAHSQTCDPVNTYCQTVTSQACELTKDTVEKVGKYVCILVPDPKWYNPGNMKTKCATEYTDKIVKGTSTCSTVLGLSCPNITGSATLSCDLAMNVVSSCIKGNANACVQAHSDAAIALTFGPTCAAYVTYAGGLLENSYETRIYNLIDDSLDVEINNIFGTLLGDVNFGNYIRGTVAFYKTSQAALTLAGVPDFGVNRAKTTPGKIFFSTMAPPKDLIIHELTHIWQFRNRGVQGLTSDGCTDFFNSSGDSKAMYKFSLVAGKKFSAYGVEQQSQIIQTYYNFKNQLTFGCGSSADFQNCSSYSSDAERMLALRNTIAGTSLTSTLLFSGTCTGQGCGSPATSCVAQNGTFQMIGNNYYCYAK